MAEIGDVEAAGPPPVVLLLFHSDECPGEDAIPAHLPRAIPKVQVPVGEPIAGRRIESGHTDREAGVLPNGELKINCPFRAVLAGQLGQDLVRWRGHPLVLKPHLQTRAVARNPHPEETGTAGVHVVQCPEHRFPHIESPCFDPLIVSSL